VPALETIVATRIVATAAAIDALAAATGPDVAVLRVAPDDALVLGAPDASSVMIDDPHAIVVAETGFSGVWLAPDALDAIVGPFIEWNVPTTRPALAQGLIAGIPAKLWLTTDRVLLLCPTAYARDFGERLS
jgi:hypothetical protein